MTDRPTAVTIDRLREILAERLGSAGTSIEHALHRAGRRLPRRLRPAAQIVIAAERMAANPRLAPRIDVARLDRAAADLTDWLMTQNPRDRRRAAVIDTTARIAFALLVTAGLFISVLVWRGLV